MTRLCTFILLALCFSLPTIAQENKFRIAVFDPTSSGTSIDDGTKIAIREIISSTIVNTGKHAIVERSLLEKVMQEQAFSQSGAVDDSQMAEIGKLAGANKIIVSVVTLTGGRNMLSVKMIDVQTANVERQKVKIVTSGELLDVVEPITLNLIGSGEPIETNDAASLQQEEGFFEPADDSAAPVPAPGEIVFYLPAGYEPKKEKERDLPLIVKLDKELIGSGTLSGGFMLRVENPGPGEHTLKIGTVKFKLDFSQYNYFEFQIYRWNYLGKAMYGVSLKERKTIK